MPRNNFTINGAEYPFDHLRSFTVDVPAKDPLASPAKILVSCSHHVFSEKWDGDKHQPEFRFIENGEVRAFCPVRYGCSIQLRQIVEYHVAGKAFESKDSNGVLRHFFYAEADGIPYPVFFNLRKADRAQGIDGILHIISAYQNANLPAKHRLQSIKFARLVSQLCPPRA